MGFFQDLKEDLSQAVNEMLPNEEVVEEAETLEEVEATEDEIETEAETLEETLDELEAEIDGLEEESEELDEEPAEEAVLEEEETYEETIVADNVESKGDKVMSDVTQIREEAADEVAMITEGMTIKGDITSKGSIDIIGNVIGNIDILGKLNVSGGIQGDSIAAEIFADSAKITGQVHSYGSVKIGQSSVIIGNIIATSAVIAGAIKGDIDVQGPVILDSSAIVMGNIKSKSVQINNGAVIEGMCSQCYADVNPVSFFNEYKK